MVAIEKPSYSWWFDSHNSPRQSPWLVSALAELDEKTKAMLKLIEQDADSFGQRAEMYYKKRPELVNMVEDFYRAHRSLAEQFDQLKQEPRTRHTTPVGSPTKSWVLKLKLPTDKAALSASSSSSSSADEESEIDDPDEVESSGTEKVERLKEENKALKAEVEEKNEEKRQTIRQLCFAMNVLKEENLELKKCIRESRKNNSSNSSSSGGGAFDLKKMGKGFFSTNLFGGFRRKHTTPMAL